MKKVKAITTALVLTTALLVGGCGASQTAKAPAAQAQKEIKLYQGLGQTAALRVGPGKDEKGGQVYSLNYVMADALFDQEGKVIHVSFDGLEVFSPNDKEHVEGGAAVFTGWPTQAGYLTAAAATEDGAKKEIANWQSKINRGDKAYGLESQLGGWSVQMGKYEDFMKGKTVAEIKDWFAKNTSDLNGRPLTEKATKPEDVAKYGKLTVEEKKALADVTSGATISLKDAHGDFVGALENAFKNKVEVTVPVK